MSERKNGCIRYSYAAGRLSRFKVVGDWKRNTPCPGPDIDTHRMVATLPVEGHSHQMEQGWSPVSGSTEPSRVHESNANYVVESGLRLVLVFWEFAKSAE